MIEATPREATRFETGPAKFSAASGISGKATRSGTTEMSAVTAGASCPATVHRGAMGAIGRGIITGGLSLGGPPECQETRYEQGFL